MDTEKQTVMSYGANFYYHSLDNPFNMALRWDLMQRSHGYNVYELVDLNIKSPNLLTFFG